MRAPSGLVLLVLLQGCLLDGAGGQAEDGGGGIDAHVPMIDAGPRDAATPPIDAPVAPVDTGVVESDAGPTCTAADERCTAEGRLRRCVDGRLETVACPTNEHCEGPSGSASCVEDVCVPGSSRCAEDDTVAMHCDAIGAEETRRVCARGCADGECRAETPCSETVDATMSEGTMTFDLCAASADTTHTLTNGCPMYDDQGTLGEEVIIRLEVPRPSRIRFQVAQAFSGALVDPTVYLRSDCAEMSSEIWCHEDSAVDGQNEDFTEDLDAGDYFLIVDRHERTTSACGSVTVTITPSPL